MKHFPKPHGYICDPTSGTCTPVHQIPRKTALLALGVAFAAGFNAAVWFTALVILR